MSDYRNPIPTVDVIIEIGEGIVLIERRNPPFGWALPGGFVDEGESLSQAAIREVKEETSLDLRLREQFFSYSAPSRDPRKHTISTVFIGEASGSPRGTDDAKRAAIFPANALPSPLAFDHGQIVADFLNYRLTGQRPPPTR
jgi:8-oxo-dGTP diphosphatase